MKRKAAALFLALVMCLSLVPVTSLASADKTYNVNISQVDCSKNYTIILTGALENGSAQVEIWCEILDVSYVSGGTYSFSIDDLNNSNFVPSVAIGDAREGGTVYTYENGVLSGTLTATDDASGLSTVVASVTVQVTEGKTATFNVNWTRPQYRDENGELVSIPADKSFAVTPETDDIRTWNAEICVVNGKVTINADTWIGGNDPTTLVLLDNADLTINGQLKIMNDLIVYGGENGTGKMTVNASAGANGEGTQVTLAGNPGAAGKDAVIASSGAPTLTVYGGNVIVNGGAGGNGASGGVSGTHSCDGGAGGVGGAGISIPTTVYGGSITATGGKGGNGGDCGYADGVTSGGYGGDAGVGGNGVSSTLAVYGGAVSVTGGKGGDGGKGGYIGTSSYPNSGDGGNGGYGASEAAAFNGGKLAATGGLGGATYTEGVTYPGTDGQTKTGMLNVTCNTLFVDADKSSYKSEPTSELTSWATTPASDLNALYSFDVTLGAATTPLFDPCNGGTIVGAETPTAPSWTDHTFAGWYDAPIGGTEVKENYEVGKTYYAHWTNTAGKIVLPSRITVKDDGVYVGINQDKNITGGVKLENLSDYGLGFTAKTTDTNVTLTMAGAEIYSMDGKGLYVDTSNAVITVKVMGDSSITAPSGADNLYGIYVPTIKSGRQAVHFIGDGEHTLTVTAGNAAKGESCGMWFPSGISADFNLSGTKSDKQVAKFVSEGGKTGSFGIKGTASSGVEIYSATFLVIRGDVEAVAGPSSNGVSAGLYGDIAIKSGIGNGTLYDTGSISLSTTGTGSNAYAGYSGSDSYNFINDGDHVSVSGGNKVQTNYRVIGYKQSGTASVKFGAEPFFYLSDGYYEYAQRTVPSGDALAYPGHTKTYTFAGWYDQSVGGTQIMDEKGNFVAKWVPAAQGEEYGHYEPAESGEAITDFISPHSYYARWKNASGNFVLPDELCIDEQEYTSENPGDVSGIAIRSVYANDTGRSDYQNMTAAEWEKYGIGFTPATNTAPAKLTLNNASISHDIDNEGKAPLMIALVGHNVVNDGYQLSQSPEEWASSVDSRYGIGSGYSLIFTGDSTSSLTAYGRDEGAIVAGEVNHTKEDNPSITFAEGFAGTVDVTTFDFQDDCISAIGDFTAYGGVFTGRNMSDDGYACLIYAGDNLTVHGGSFTFKEGKAGVKSSTMLFGGDSVTINGGVFATECVPDEMPSLIGSYSGNISIYGGQITGNYVDNGYGVIYTGGTGTLTLGTKSSPAKVQNGTYYTKKQSGLSDPAALEPSTYYGTVTNNALNAAEGQTLVISFKDPVTVTGVSMNAESYTYGGSAVGYTGTPAAKNQEGTPVTISSWTYTYYNAATGESLGTTPPTNAGSYKLVVEAADTDYEGKQTIEFTIAPKQISVTFADVAAQEFTGAQIKPAISVAPTGATLTAVTDYTISYDENVNAGTNAGSVTVSPVDGSNYTFTAVTKNFDITPKRVAVTWATETSYTYTGDAQTAPTASYQSAVSVKVDCTVVEDNSKEFKNAGTYNFTATTENGNYTLTNDTLEIQIGKVTLTPSVASVESKGYDGTTTAAGTLSLSGAVNSETPTATGTFTWTSAAVGTNTVDVASIALGTDFTTNYELSVTKLDNVTAPNSVAIAKAATPPKGTPSVYTENAVSGNTVTLTAMGITLDGAKIKSIAPKGTATANVIATTPTIAQDSKSISWTTVATPSLTESDVYTLTVESTNYADFTLDVTFTGKTTVSFDPQAKPVNGGNTITYSDSGTTYTVATPTVMVGGTALNPQPEMTVTYYESDGNGGWAALEAKPTNAGSYKVVFAVKEDDATYTGSAEYAYEIAKATVSAPALVDSVTINYTAEKITPKKDYEVSTATDFSTKLSGETAVDFTKSYYIRKVGDANHNASAVLIYTPARPTTPAAPTLNSKTDTAITVKTVTGQEYSLDGTNWQDSGEFTNLTAGQDYTIYTRIKAVTTGTNAFASAKSSALQVTTKTAPAAAPVISTATDVIVTANSVALPVEGTPNSYEYSTNGTNWTATNTYIGLTEATEYTYYVRVKETDTAMPSNTATITVHTAFATPATGEGYTVYYANEKISVTEGYEVSTATDFGTTLASGSDITPNTTYYVRKAADGSVPASAYKSFTAPARPAAPVRADFVVKQETLKNRGDASISGLNKEKHEVFFEAYPSLGWNKGYEEIKNQPGGTTIKIRKAATENAFASDALTIPLTPSEQLITVKMGDASDKVAVDELVEKKIPAKDGYTFGGWFLDEELQNPWNFAADTIEPWLGTLEGEGKLTENFEVTFYPKWIKNTIPSKAIGGVVTQNSEPVPNATVELFLGTINVASTMTNSSGNYSFDSVEDGTYNIVVAKDGKTKTAMVTVSSVGDYTTDVEMPTQNVSSVVKCEGIPEENAKSNVQKTVVGGLDAVAVANAEEGKIVTVKLTVEPKDESDVASASDIKALAGSGKKVEFLDLSLTKTVGSNGEVNIGGDNSTLLTIVIPFDFTGVDVSSVMILRNHNGNSEKLTENPTEGNEGFVVDRQAGTITLYAMKFSDYAVAYKEQSGNGGHSGGSYAPGHTVTSDLNNVTKVTIDGKIVDKKYYTVSGGNVVLSGEFMKTLTNGKHTVKLYNGLKSATGIITVTGNVGVTSAPTGDVGITLYGALTISSLLGIGWVGRKRYGEE